MTDDGEGMWEMGDGRWEGVTIPFVSLLGSEGFVVKTVFFYFFRVLATWRDQLPFSLRELRGLRIH